jgi:hypothetical protein
MKFGRTGIAVIGLFAVSAIGCPQPSHKKNDAGEETGGEGGDATGGTTSTGGKTMTMTNTGGSTGDTGGSTGSTGGTTGNTGGSMGTGGSMSTGGSSGNADGGPKDSGGGGGMGGGGGGADMAAFMTLYDGLIKPKCGPACHITGTSGGLGMQTAAMAFTNLVNKASGCTGIMRVTPGDPTKSVLSLIVKGKGVMGCTARPNQMPKGKTPLTAAEIQMIDDWIMGK